MLIRQRELFAPLGLVCLTLSLLLERMGRGIIAPVPFVEGLFLGLAFAFGLAGIVITVVRRGYE